MAAASDPAGAPLCVRASGLAVRYASRRAWAVSGVDLDIAPGERVLLTGASGSGKSTLLYAIGGLLDGGEELTGSLTVGGGPPALARDRLGLVAQDPDSQLVMTRVGDDVAFGLENAGVDPALIWPQVVDVLRRIAFPYGNAHPTQALSGGQKQRLALAGALVRRPGLLLLDEPTSQLDPSGAALVRAAVAQVAADRAVTVVLVDHDAGPWLPLVDRVIEVQTDGGVRCHGPSWRPATRTAALTLPAVPEVASVALDAVAVGFSYPRDTSPALAPTDAALRAGRVLAVTGKNGTGKSTLALLLSGLRAPTTGRVRVCSDLAARGERDPTRWRAAELVTRIGSVFQQPEQQFLTGRVRDELALGPLRSGRDAGAARGRAEELLERLGLSAFAEANPFTLSGGQQRRLSVATALATSPRVLILDEPTFGQDAATWREVVLLLAEQRAAGAALAVVTHDHDLVAALADDELVLT